jgi:hypothetical protein
MPTVNPRITVTLKPSTYAAFKRMAVVSKTSISALLADLAEQAQPVLGRMVQVIEAAQTAQESVKQSVSANLEAAEALLNEQLGLMLDDSEKRSNDLVDGLEAISRRSGRGATAAAPAAKRLVRQPVSRPPISNRGGATPNPLKGKGAKFRPGKSKRGLQ